MTGPLASHCRYSEMPLRCQLLAMSGPFASRHRYGGMPPRCQLLAANGPLMGHKRAAYGAVAARNKLCVAAILFIDASCFL